MAIPGQGLGTGSRRGGAPREARASRCGPRVEQGPGADSDGVAAVGEPRVPLQPAGWLTAYFPRGGTIRLEVEEIRWSADTPASHTRGPERGPVSPCPLARWPPERPR